MKHRRMTDRMTLFDGLLCKPIPLKLFKRARLNHQCLRPLNGLATFVDDAYGQPAASHFNSQCKPVGPAPTTTTPPRTISIMGMIYERSFTFIECPKSGVGMTIGGW